MAKKALGKFFTDKKYRPFLIGGLVIIGLLVLFSLLGRGSGASAGASAGASGPSEALQAKMIDAQLQGASIQASLTAASIQANADVAQAQLAADVEARNIDASLAAAGLQAQADVYATEKAAELQTLQTTANRDVQLATLAEATRREEIYAQTTIANASILADTQKFFAAQAAATQFAYLEADIAKEQIGANVMIANIEAGRDVALADYNLKADAISRSKRKHIPAILAGDSPQLGTKTNAIIGGITSLGGLLSDLRVKEEIEWSGVNDGYNWYEYREKKLFGKGKKKAGVMAQEMPIEYAALMGPVMGVNYAAMAYDADMHYSEAL